ncbi:hypothetical protein Y032_0059g3071 [Ancylostoma ceylanicum]|uniref:Uncharacterized protein n=1 Tax=Ancylostoma ceylanicum TaxID=53326 RepID=A0A016U3V3_9BILA|nr:hypothetical protein Y032_0059g3071 [Ancylostoma ceylanicum]
MYHTIFIIGPHLAEFVTSSSFLAFYCTVDNVQCYIFCCFMERNIDQQKRSCVCTVVSSGRSQPTRHLEFNDESLPKNRVFPQERCQ